MRRQRAGSAPAAAVAHCGSAPAAGLPIASAIAAAAARSKAWRGTDEGSGERKGLLSIYKLSVTMGYGRVQGNTLSPVVSDKQVRRRIAKYS